MGRRLSERRRELKLTQERLVEMVGISPSFVGHLERAEKTPSLATVAELCAALNISVDYLVWGKRSVRCDQNHCALYEEIRRAMDAYQI